MPIEIWLNKDSFIIKFSIDVQFISIIVRLYEERVKNFNFWFSEILGRCIIASCIMELKATQRRLTNKLNMQNLQTYKAAHQDKVGINSPVDWQSIEYCQHMFKILLV